MRSFRKPEWRAVPPRKKLTKEHVRSLAPTRIETAEQARERVVKLLASIGLTNEIMPHHRPTAFALPGFVRGKPQRRRWWLVSTVGGREAPSPEEWDLIAIIDSLTGELRWWRFWYHDASERQRLINESIEREQRRER